MRQEELAMAAYLIANVEVNNPDAYLEYRQRFDPILETYQGKLIVGGGPCEALEGDWLPERLIVLEFPSAELARAWYESPEYGEIAPIRHQHATTHFLTLVHGFTSR
jgi:uncharacterized protein (DUF1330 family)